MKLLSMKEVAESLGVHTKTVSRWVRLQGFPAMRMHNRTFRFEMDDVVAWLRGRSNTDVLRNYENRKDDKRKLVRGGVEIESGK